MSIGVVLQDENGKEIRSILDPRNDMNRLLPDYTEEAFPYLRYVDPYGDTIFNGFQIHQAVKDELRRLVERTAAPDEQEMGRAVLELFDECQPSSHRYIRFLGD